MFMFMRFLSIVIIKLYEKYLEPNYWKILKIRFHLFFVLFIFFDFLFLEFFENEL
jgi:hypothetical protein